MKNINPQVINTDGVGRESSLLKICGIVISYITIINKKIMRKKKRVFSKEAFRINPFS
jgi:hypothetical protein